MAETKTKEEVKAGLPALPMVDVYDLVDVDQIIEQLRKAVTEKWAYKIKFGDTYAKGLGIVGAREVAVIIAKLSKGQHVIRAMEIMRLEETAEAWEANVLVGLWIVGIVDGKAVELCLNTIVGSCRQPKLGTRKDGSTWVIQLPDKLAVSKATRKGIESFIPDKWTERIVDIADKEGKMRDESDESKSAGSDNGKDSKPTKAQIEGLNRRLKNKHIDEPTREHYENAMGLGMDKWQASRAIKTLDQIIKAGEDKNAKKSKGSQSSGEGLF